MALADKQSNCKAWWSFDEASGTRADETTNGNDLTDNGAVAQVSGLVGNAADFTPNDWFNITDAAQTGLDITGDISIAFVINRDSNTGDRWIYSKSRFDGGNQGVDIWQNAGKIFGRISDDGSNSATHKVDFNTTNAVLTSGTTHTVVFTFDISSETVTIYVDGSSVAITKTGSMGASIYDNAMDVVIGRRNRTTPGQYFAGWIDEMSVWDILLDSSDAAELHNSGSWVSYNDIFGGGGGGSSIKSMYGITQANMKSVHGITNANIKSIHGIANS